MDGVLRFQSWVGYEIRFSHTMCASITHFTAICTDQILKENVSFKREVSGKCGEIDSELAHVAWAKRRGYQNAFMLMKMNLDLK